MLRHLIIGPGPCNFEIHKYRLFLESVCVGKQEIGLISDPSTKGHKIPHFRCKVTGSKSGTFYSGKCNFPGLLDKTEIPIIGFLGV